MKPTDILIYLDLILSTKNWVDKELWVMWGQTILCTTSMYLVEVKIICEGHKHLAHLPLFFWESMLVYSVLESGRTPVLYSTGGRTVVKTSSFYNHFYLQENGFGIKHTITNETFVIIYLSSSTKFTSFIKQYAIS